jgi:hypothetical protein
MAPNQLPHKLMVEQLWQLQLNTHSLFVLLHPQNIHTYQKNYVFHFAIQQLPLIHHLLQHASEPAPTIFPATATKIPLTTIDYSLCKVYS